MMPRTGRPRRFDKDGAVDLAMRSFWSQGYDATSISQLRTAMGGISSASFYAAFESKEALFRAVLARYLETHGQVTASLYNRALSPRVAVETALRRSAHMQTDPDQPGGCLVVTSAIVCSAEAQAVQALLAEERTRTRDGFLACVQQGVAVGELSSGTDIAAMAAMFHSFLLGISVQARDGVAPAIIDAAITGLMRVWHRPEPTPPSIGGNPSPPRQT